MEEVAQILAELEELLDEIGQGKIKNLILGEKRSGIIGDGRERYSTSEWEPGDPFASIDWRATLPYWPEKIFKVDRIETKNLPLMLALDATPSMLVRFHGNDSKLRLMLLLAGTLGFSSAREHDPVGITCFGSRNELFLPPRYGKGNILLAIETLLEDARDFYTSIDRSKELPRSYLASLDVNECLSDVMARVLSQSVIVVISDFLDILYDVTVLDERLLGNLVARHKENVIFIILDDENEFGWSGGYGMIMTRNIETGARQEIEAGHAETIRIEHAQKQVLFQKYLEDQGIDSLVVSSNNWFDRLADFVASRQ